MNIKLRAKNLIERCGTKNLFRICEKLKIDIIFTNIGDIKGFYNSVLGNKYIIINEMLSEAEAKVVLAHELGHAILHSTRCTRFMLDYTNIIRTAKQEKEANEFASYLLREIFGEDDILQDEFMLKIEILQEIKSYLK